eukprot:jgi/Bigna1/91235/estExt_fgenesh1_pg.C_940003
MADRRARSFRSVTTTLTQIYRSRAIQGARFLQLMTAATFISAFVILGVMFPPSELGSASIVPLRVRSSRSSYQRNDARAAFGNHRRQLMDPLLRGSMGYLPYADRCERTRINAAGGKKEPEFFSANIDSIKPACEGGKVYSVVVNSPRTSAKYEKAGQYAQMRVGDSKPGFFAMANKPGSEKLEFLIKSVDGTAGIINEMKPGDSLEISDAMGNGFPWDRVSDNEAFSDGTYVFATGTGFGPIRAMIESGLFKGRKNLKIYYGVRDTKQMPFKDEFGKWMEQGLLGEDGGDNPIVPVFSCEQKGYVQDVAVFGSDLDPEKTTAVICGHWDMTGKLKERLTEELGIPMENILTNF